MRGAAILRAEEQGDAPKTRQTHQTVNDAGEQGQLAAEEEGHGVEPEEADAAPVQRADDHQDQRKFVDDALHIAGKSASSGQMVRFIGRNTQYNFFVKR